MHIQVVSFRLEGMGEEDYRGIAGVMAPAFANLPGLVSKTWLADPETGTYGGVYVWESREAMEDYKGADIYKGMAANPRFAELVVKDFAVLEGPTRVTRGSAAGVAAWLGNGKGIPMVHNLNDRELWSKQGEEYLRKVRSTPPVHPLIAAAQASRGAGGERYVKPAA